ncbi:MAG: HAMP domain-containing sensor histidine kinase [Oscillospiraceae bacterium]|nr:HAMP domain-containing sensor histidine kinase [Oscillospiraceae bacterium]
MNNKDTRRSMILLAVIEIVSTLLTALFSWKLCAFVFAVGLVYILAFYLRARRRYLAVTEMTNKLNRILLGEKGLTLNSFCEGELSILENEIQKLLLHLKSQNEALKNERLYLSDSIADISHQIRTPLTSINLILTLLQKPDITPERRSELLRELSSLIMRMDGLVTALLKISKIDAGTIEFEREKVSVRSLIERSAQSILIPMDIRNQQLHIEVGEEYYMGDIEWSAEAFGNILKNAMEHTPENGEITVSCTQTPIYTEIIVRDTGSGFDEEELPHIFDRFYKGKNNTKESFGIGLALARSIIYNQNGTIKAENAYEGGAKFTVRFYKGTV